MTPSTHWDELRPLLAKYGFVGEPANLPGQHVALAGVRAETDPRLPSGGAQIFGIQLSVAQFSSAVGMLLAVISSAMIGPLLALRSSSDRKHSRSWVLVLPRSAGGARRLLEWTICSVTIFWTLAPILVLLLQARSFVAVDATVGWPFGVGAIGLVTSGITHGFVGRKLRVTRLAGSRHSDASLPA
jgi:hypothetical protein